MIKGLYTAAAGMLATTVQTDTLANNLANVNTAGFKKNGVNFQGFPEMLMQRIDANGVQKIGSMMSGSKVRSTATDFHQGNLHASGNPLDVAIEGDGFFTVQDAQGNRFYTRNGAFTLNEQGYLITQEGLFVQSQGGNILVPPEIGHDIKIGNDGLISAGPRVLGQLEITRFKSNGLLEKQGQNLFRMPDPSGILDTPGPEDGAGYQIFQGTIETSNVNVVAELVNNITGMRLYESLQKNIQMHNQTLEKAVNDVGRYR